MPLLQQGLAQLQSGDAAAARATLDRVLARDPDNFDALNLAGVAATRLGEPEAASRLLERAVAIRPEHAGALVNLGVAARAASRPEAALAAYSRAVELQPAYAAAQLNLASVLTELSRFDEALLAFDRALRLRPDHAETLAQRGTLLRRQRRYRDALASIDRSLALLPDEPRYHLERAKTLKAMGRHGDSLQSYRQAAALSPDGDELLGPILWPKLKMCDWQGREELIDRTTGQVLAGRSTINPFTSLLIFDDPALQLAVARQWSADFRRASPAVAAPASDRIRIGYFSADFRNHPMMHLMGELLARHDRRRFEVFGFAFNVGEGDRYTAEARRSVDEFIDVDGLSDADVAALSRQRGIDIAIDRKGYTTQARTGIFAQRAAPVQVNYLAYPGTMGAEFMDYIVADRTIIPEQALQHYAEKVVWMPHCYAPRDTRVVVPEAGTLREAGLPQDAFVFCCFNQSSKITPEVFALWMDILKRIATGVLWLFDDNAEARENLRAHAASHGVDPARLVFAPPQPQPEHLARLRLADLCLDTLPYNAHTTANDALYVGVPVLTLPGETFAARVCASLLNAVGMPELIVADADAYVEQAVAIAGDPARLAALKQRLGRAKAGAPLYDMGRYVTALEAAYQAMHERRLAGLPPDHIAIEP